MAQRVTYRRRHSYATKSNKIRKVKTGSTGMHQDVPAEDVIIEKAEVV